MNTFATAGYLVGWAPLVGQKQPSENRQQPVFAMSISLEQSTTAPGSEVAIDVELTNVSDKEIQIVRVSGPPLYTFKVLEEDGKPAPLTPAGEAIAGGKTCWKGKNGEMRALGDVVLLGSGLLLVAKRMMSLCYQPTLI